jgi:ubiquinone/menaquinone biosynthesis C-methylase UbiE
LLEDAIVDGYIMSVGNTLKCWISDEVAFASAGRKLDLLEIGGGRGTLFEWVKDSARTYINVDPVCSACRRLGEVGGPRYARIGCSAEAIPLEDESVDAVISASSFDHIPEYRKALSEVSRLLRKNYSYHSYLKFGGIYCRSPTASAAFWLRDTERTSLPYARSAAERVGLEPEAARL